MNEQEEFFEPNHKRLLSIATWAKYLAWVALVIYTLWAMLIVFMSFSNNGNPIQPPVGLGEGFKSAIDVAGTFLKGVIYYLVLKGISLGLNMIVETDINYRDREREQVAQ
ncbi:MAG TPA: hypothetical protein VHP14_07455 [Anaerolineales bacterium]|nr:hypothetical protein [Anaerolineales bacterium]